jgi:hypothetical protein
MMLMVRAVAAMNRTSKYGELKARRNLEQKVAGGELETWRSNTSSQIPVEADQMRVEECWAEVKNARSALKASDGAWVSRC